jgi:hypothetical protein
MFCRLKDFRRVAAHYDKLARDFLSPISLAAAVAFGLSSSLNLRLSSRLPLRLLTAGFERILA